MSKLQRVLHQMHYCCLCNKPGRMYKLGAPAKFFGHTRTRVVLCNACLPRVTPLLRQLHVVYRNQGRLLEKLNVKETHPYYNRKS